jgi:hypothetical protein
MLCCCSLCRRDPRNERDPKYHFDMDNLACRVQTDPSGSKAHPGRQTRCDVAATGLPTSNQGPAHCPGCSDLKSSGPCPGGWSLKGRNLAPWAPTLKFGLQGSDLNVRAPGFRSQSSGPHIQFDVAAPGAATSNRCHRPGWLRQTLRSECPGVGPEL